MAYLMRGRIVCKSHTWEDRIVTCPGKLIGLCVAALLTVGSALAGAQNPLPDAAPFLAQVRAHLRLDRQLLSQYTFLERETKIHLTKFGTLTTGPVQVFEVYPGLEPDDTYRRLITIDGKPRDPAELEKDDRRRQKHVLEEFEKRRREDPATRAQRIER